MKQKLKIFLNGIGYRYEFRDLEGAKGLRLTNIRRFPSEGRLARIARKLDKLFR